MKPKLLSTAANGDQLWVNREHPNGKMSGFILQINKIKRPVDDVGMALQSARWPSDENIDKYLQRREPKKPKLINYPDFDRPMNRMRKPDNDDTPRPRQRPT